MDNKAFLFFYQNAYLNSSFFKKNCLKKLSSLSKKTSDGTYDNSAYTKKVFFFDFACCKFVLKEDEGYDTRFLEFLLEGGDDKKTFFEVCVKLYDRYIIHDKCKGYRVHSSVKEFEELTQRVDREALGEYTHMAEKVLECCKYYLSEENFQELNKLINDREVLINQGRVKEDVLELGFRVCDFITEHVMDDGPTIPCTNGVPDFIHETNEIFVAFIENKTIPTEDFKQYKRNREVYLKELNEDVERFKFEQETERVIINNVIKFIDNHYYSW